MKILFLVVCPLLVACQAFIVFTSCATQAQRKAQQAYEETVLEAGRDGVISPEEWQKIDARRADYDAAPDWATIIGTGVGTIGVMLGLLRVLPNQHIVGKDEAAALNKAAGLD